MNQELNKKIGVYGKANIVLGIISIVSGVAIGTLIIIFGGNILKERC